MTLLYIDIDKIESIRRALLTNTQKRHVVQMWSAMLSTKCLRFFFFKKTLFLRSFRRALLTVGCRLGGGVMITETSRKPCVFFGCGSSEVRV